MAPDKRGKAFRYGQALGYMLVTVLLVVVISGLYGLIRFFMTGSFWG